MMTELIPLTINLLEEQYKRLEYLAKTYGYETVEAYAMAVIEEVLDEPTKEEILEDIRISFREASRGETIPIEDVLAELEAEDD
ncbi:MAG: hypothetical protein LCI00_16660 [Chloroflexi bacterium]|nr:hypothetical protein [Chloroflexota bacterium]MCC6896622.1 hypothetical protein [Anaerolineae bacterium]